jgi:hypothetical protein
MFEAATRYLPISVADAAHRCPVPSAASTIVDALLGYGDLDQGTVVEKGDRHVTGRYG